MPYRINPKNGREIQIRKGGKWTRYRVANSHEGAQALLAKFKEAEKKEKGRG